MNIRKELNRLEKKGVFIHTRYEHYGDGSNLCFSIEFKNYKEQTGWYNDNHEFGDGGDTFKSAIKLAKWFLKDKIRILYVNSSFLSSEVQKNI